MADIVRLDKKARHNMLYAKNTMLKTQKKWFQNGGANISNIYPFYKSKENTTKNCQNQLF